MDSIDGMNEADLRAEVRRLREELAIWKPPPRKCSNCGDHSVHASEHFKGGRSPGWTCGNPDRAKLRASVAAACRREQEAEDYAPPTVEDLAREDDEDDHDLRGAR